MCEGGCSRLTDTDIIFNILALDFIIMRKALTLLLILLTYFVSAQDAKNIEFRNITGRILQAANQPGEVYTVAYYGTELGTHTDKLGKFNLNLPIGMPVLLKITDGKKLVLFYKVNPEDKVIAISADEKLISASNDLLAEWDKNKASNERLMKSIYHTSKFEDFLRKHEPRDEDDADIVLPSDPVPNVVANEPNKVYMFHECEVKPTSVTKGLIFSNFAKANLVYPKFARENSIQGKAYVSAVIEPNGTLSNIAIVRSLSPECDKEAIRLVKLAKWTPGSVGGKKVRTALNEFVSFQLQ